jgi:hypothetical protein
MVCVWLFHVRWGVWYGGRGEIALVLLMHKNTKPEHGGSVFGREYIRRMKINADHKLMCNYFFENPLFCEKYFRHQFWLCLLIIQAYCRMCEDPWSLLEQRRSCTGVLGHSTYQKGDCRNCEWWHIPFPQTLLMITWQWLRAKQSSCETLCSGDDLGVRAWVFESTWYSWHGSVVGA